MAILALPALLLAFAPPGPPSDGVAFAQLTIHPRIVIRIPRILGGHRAERSEPGELRMVEKKGPRCVPIVALGAAIFSNDDSVDLVIADGTRLRAKFDEKCPALDFYSGLYLKSTADGMVCADRDAIRSRSGSTCRIDGFKRLVVKRK